MKQNEDFIFNCYLRTKKNKKGLYLFFLDKYFNKKTKTDFLKFGLFNIEERKELVNIVYENENLKDMYIDKSLDNHLTIPKPKNKEQEDFIRQVAKIYRRDLLEDKKLKKFDIFEFASKGKKSKDNRLIESVDVPKLIERILPGFHFEKHNVIETEGSYWFSNQQAKDENKKHLSIVLKICKDEKIAHKETGHLAMMRAVIPPKTNIKIGDELFIWRSAVNPRGGSILFRRKNVVVDTGSLLFKERLKLAEKIDKALQEKSEYVKFKKIFQHVKKGDYEVREEVA